MLSKLQSESPEPTADAPLDQTRLDCLVGYNLRRAYVLNVTPNFSKRMAKYRLTPVEYTILVLLKSNPNINQKRLSKAINVSPPNMATLLDRLETRSLLSRQRNPLDKRSQTLVLTAEGLRLCSKAEKAIEELEVDVASALTETERAELLRLLQKMSVPKAQT
ncbi:MarR family transcriptional regulator [Herbaspirillum sp. HC18]|nr:MarR family transcriptional regulator [Herbaspirillum sp. HC18]